MNMFDLPALQRTAAPSAVPAPEALHARVLLDTATNGLYVVRDGAIVYANPASAAMLGWPAGALMGQPHTVVMAREFQSVVDASVRAHLAGEPATAAEMRCQRLDGSGLDVRVLARRVVFDGHASVLMTLVDIGELKQAVRRAEWNASMLARTEALCGAGSLEVAWPSGRLHISAGLAALLGLPGGGTHEADLETLAWVPADERAYVAGIWRNAVAGEQFEFRHRVVRADGRRLVVVHRGQLGIDGRGVALLQDVTAQVEADQRIQELATHHDVTGLPNRGWLLDQVEAAVCAARWAAEPRGIALLTIDIPRIAEMKANMGFGAGDTLCMALAARLRTACGAGEAVAQLGDTEFALLLDSSAGEAAREAVRQRALTLQAALQAPVRLGATDVHPQCIVGMAAFPADGDCADRLLECAQNARLDVEGGAGVAFFRPESATRALRAMTIESALWRALHGNEFELHYQPQVDLATGRVSGAEALLRWQSPELGAVAPGEFIPVAERSGLIGAVGDWVLEQACRQVGQWKRAGLPQVRVAVNLASSQLQQPDLAARVQALMLQHGVEPAWLGVELTESMVMADVERCAATLRAIKDIGVEISIDDFGTGFSSLSCLSRLPIDVVKIDRSFVRDVTVDAQDVSVTRAIIQMTRSLQMRSLAEGVETDGQLSLLVAAGCDEFQGWWFSKALPAAEFAALLRSGRCIEQRHLRGEGRATAEDTLAQRLDAASADVAELQLRLARSEGLQQRQARLLRDNATGLREVFDNLPAVVLALDADGMLGFANREAERLLPGVAAQLGALLVGQLPAALQALLAGAGRQCSAVIEGLAFEARRSDLPGAAAGHLLLLTPQVPA